MSWDELLEGLFSGYFKVKDRFKKKQKQNLITAPHTVRLEEISSKLSIIARAITGSPIEIVPAEREGGYKNNFFFLPVFYADFDSWQENLEFYLFRVLYLSTQKKLNLNGQAPEKFELKEARQKAAEHAPQILEELFSDYPGIKPVYDKLFKHYQEQAEENQPADFTFIYGKWMSNQLENEGNDKLKNINEHFKKGIKDEIDTILKANAVEEMETQQVDKKQQADQVVHNYYEKIETLEEHQGGIWKDFDGDDELETRSKCVR